MFLYLCRAQYLDSCYQFVAIIDISPTNCFPVQAAQKCARTIGVCLHTGVMKSAANDKHCCETADSTVPGCSVRVRQPRFVYLWKCFRVLNEKKVCVGGYSPLHSKNLLICAPISQDCLIVIGFSRTTSLFTFCKMTHQAKHVILSHMNKLSIHSTVVSIGK
jgi:hypothetical protein